MPMGELEPMLRAASKAGGDVRGWEPSIAPCCDFGAPLHQQVPHLRLQTTHEHQHEH